MQIVNQHETYKRELMTDLWNDIHKTNVIQRKTTVKQEEKCRIQNDDSPKKTNEWEIPENLPKGSIKLAPLQKKGKEKCLI